MFPTGRLPWELPSSVMVGGFFYKIIHKKFGNIGFSSYVSIVIRD